MKEVISKSGKMKNMFMLEEHVPGQPRKLSDDT